MARKKKEPTVYELLAEAEEIRRELYNKALLLRKVATDYYAVKRIANEIKDLVKPK